MKHVMRIITAFVMTGSTFSLFGQTSVIPGNGHFTVGGSLSSSRSGTIYADLLTQEKYEHKKTGVFYLVLPADEPGKQVEFAFNDVPGDSYVLVSYQGLNGNRKLDWNFFHPIEPAAIFRPAQPFLGMPRFEDVKFEVLSARTDIILKLRHWETNE